MIINHQQIDATQNSAVIEFTVPSSSNYQIQVTSSNPDSMGSYTLSTASVVNSGGGGTGSILFGTDASGNQYSAFTTANDYYGVYGVPTSSVYRAGNGYIQEMQGLDGFGKYYLMLEDGASRAFLLGGDALNYYLNNGGVGRFGYPVSEVVVDPKNNFSTQYFENGSLVIHDGAVYGYDGPPPITGTPVSTPSTQPIQTGQVNNTIGLNFRSQPSESGDNKLGALPFNTKFTIIQKVDGEFYNNGSRNDWYEIEYNGKRGYVAAGYVDIVGTDNPVVTQPTAPNNQPDSYIKFNNTGLGHSSQEIAKPGVVDYKYSMYINYEGSASAWGVSSGQTGQYRWAKADSNAKGSWDLVVQNDNASIAAIQVFIPTGSTAEKAKYEIYDAEGKLRQITIVNQAQNVGKWVDLDSFFVNKGDKVTVVLKASGESGKKLSFDDMRWVDGAVKDWNDGNNGYGNGYYDEPSKAQLITDYSYVGPGTDLDVVKDWSNFQLSIDKSYKSQNYEPRPSDVKIDMIVYHHTGFEANIAIDRFTSPIPLINNGLSAHYIVGNEGIIYEIVNPDDKAYHAGGTYNNIGFNSRSIGIEIVNANGNEHPYHKEQYRSLQLLTLHLLKKYPSIRFLTGHQDVEEVSDKKSGKTDPGELFDWNAIKIAADRAPDASSKIRYIGNHDLSKLL
ncbi:MULTISPECIES: N-acetylmuramoyl-L-alanine amidase [unclassified Anabaena]|uniref:N-acetylmuramoyl-L-alanine amidase n=1 Tax=unclassified Anabaena TaxID=2619674 RepID=UPI001448721B|nr:MULTISPECIES: N-acetylmuramoyl-L-alanine amidase [unclassified Anabaena]MTJ09823.1 SH3 domain-containing protein [Anabaena sp. UHCC 0204]MTJ53352.1 SH3 domain-containing protein [Anabaena sp. UHCC 0253]